MSCVDVNNGDNDEEDWVRGRMGEVHTEDEM